MAIREGKWKCTYCDAMNRGRDMKCAGCGATREKDVEFIYDENAAEVTDAAEVKVAQSGPEWICETCGTSNASTREDCRQCAAPRGGSQFREEKMVEQPAPPPPPPSKPFPWKKVLLAAGAVTGVFFIGLVMLIALALHTHSAELKVTGAQWQRSIDVEELHTLTKQDWQDQVPSDARVISRHSEFYRNEKVQVGTHTVQKTRTEKVQVGTKRVKTGTKNKGNGYFEDVYKDEPVYENQQHTETVEEPTYVDKPIYKDKVTYQVDRWEKTRTEQAQGSDNSPAWPKIATSSTTREGQRNEKYVVSLQDVKSQKTYQQEVKEAEFAQMTPGTICQAEINTFDSINSLKPLKH
jgi:hypothetical protein